MVPNALISIVVLAAVQSRTSGTLFQISGFVLLLVSAAIGGNALINPSCVDGHYLSVREFDSEISSAHETAQFSNLTDDQQRMVTEGLDQRSVRVTRSAVGILSLAVVTYRGQTYETQIAVQDCGNTRERKMGGGVAGILLGLALIANGRGWVGDDQGQF